MTLDTRIVIQSPVRPRDVFVECRRLLDCTQYDAWEEKDGYMPQTRVLSNTPGQGLPGWLMVFYCPDGPLSRDEGEPDGFVEVSIDTGYGFQADNGAGCGDLHAGFVDLLGHWLDERGLTWQWRDEATGIWYEGFDHLDSGGSPWTKDGLGNIALGREYLLGRMDALV